MVFFWHVVTYPDPDYECGSGIALLSAMSIDFGLLPYACNKEIQENVQTRAVYWLN